MKTTYLICLLFLFTLTVQSQIKHGLRDAQGRHVVSRGFVVNTNDHKGEVSFNSDDYLRMERMGANAQVIRLELGKLSSFPGGKLDQQYLKKLDTLVAHGKNSGMKTVFKMTVYGVDSFVWEDFWQNKKNEYETYINAWRVIWKRYATESAVLGYDIVNEPRKLTMDISYTELTKKYLVPLYQKIIDACHEINADKKVLVQSIFMNKGEGIDNNQYAEITVPINRKNVIFAPHIYQDKIEFIKPVMDRFDKESKLLDAPIYIGEWGFPTFASTDTLISGKLGQLKYRETDVIARPYPQTIAGDIQNFMFHFATRTLDLNLRSDNSKGASTIFIGANRHYPDGFSILIDADFVMYHNPLKNAGLEVYKLPENVNPSDFIWDDKTQKLIILKWPKDKSELHVKIVPGIHDFKVLE